MISNILSAFAGAAFSDACPLPQRAERAPQRDRFTAVLQLPLRHASAWKHEKSRVVSNAAL